MANTCGLFGDLVPNIYIDRVFLEESVVDANNDGTIDLKTPTITINLKVLDSISDGGTFSILGDALQVQNSNGTIDFKKYFKVHNILFTSQEDADTFITDFERQNYTQTSGYFYLPQTGASYLIQTKDLNDFTNTYLNSDGVTEIIESYEFQLDQGSDIDYLRVFTFVELDTRTLEADLDIELPDSFKNLISRYRDEVIIQNSQIVAQLTIFTTEDGDLWDDSFHLMSDGRYMTGRTHQGIDSEQLLVKGSTTVFNVQDFRLQDEINAFVANFDFTNSTQNTFPEQSDILNQALSKKTYFSELFITKDAERSARYYFAFDYGAYVLENIKFSALASSMSEEGKKKIIDNSEILNLTVSRTQVQKQPYRNHLGSPLKNRVASDSTIKTPLVAGTLGDDNLNEIGLILTEQPDTPGSIIRHFTGLDELMSETEDGVFQYSVDVEINDGFVPVMREVLANLSSAIALYNNYVALTNIPNVYDTQNRKFTTSGQEIMNSFGSDNLANIINTYLDTLDLFVDIDTQITNGGGITVRGALESNISRNISPTVGSVDGIILFQNIINNLLAQINDVLSVGSNSVGVEATTTNRQADSISSLKVTTIKTSEVFENTIDARFLNDSYVNNISAAFGTFNGLNVYAGENLANATRTEVTPINLFMSQQEALAERGIVFSSLTSVGQKDTNVSSTKYLGQESEGATGNLNAQNLSPQDLQQSGVVLDLTGQLDAFTLTQERLTQDDLQTQVDVLVGFTVRGIVNAAFTNTYMIKGAEFETKQLGELVSAFPERYFLCKQTRRSDIEVVDSYFLLTPVSVGGVLEQSVEATTNITQEGVNYAALFVEVDTEELQQTQRFTSFNTLATRGY